MPKNRKKIITRVVGPEERNRAYQFIRKEVLDGRQVFVICPRIENTKKKDDFGTPTAWSEVKTVKEEFQKLTSYVFPDLVIGILHGKMTNKEKDKVMKEFKTRRIDVLVSTSVIEVGIDIPNATVMMIEGADRFGLAQLHQFRGRVGRDKYQSYCFLLTESNSATTKARLKALITCDDGFKLAEKDLEIRGPGDLSGKRQWGVPDLMMDSLRDLPLIEKTREAAKNILQEDPALKSYPNLQNKLKLFREKVHLE